MSIKKAQNHFAIIDKWAKLSTGLTEPNAGPILPNEDAAAPMADSKSNPKKVNIIELRINIPIYSTKKAKILKTIFFGTPLPL